MPELPVSNAIHISQMVFSWPGSDNPVLNIPDWQVAAGERIFLHGPSGSGKTTLLNLLCGITTPQKGRILITGTDIGSLNSRQRDRFRAQSVGVIFQQFNLIPYLNLTDNIRLAAIFGKPARRRETPDAVDYRISEILDKLNLPRACHLQKAAQLSVGQQQRVAIARALINNPPVIIADEPTSALDADARNDFITALLACAAASQSTVLFVSHDHSLAGNFDRSVDLRAINSVAQSFATREAANVP